MYFTYPTSTPFTLLPFNRVLINVGKAWVTSRNAAIIPRAGVYYVYMHMSTSCCSVAAMQLNVNNEPQFEAKFLFVTNYTASGRSNGAVVRLAAGDRVTVQVPPILNIGLFGTDDSRVALYGMLLGVL